MIDNLKPALVSRILELRLFSVYPSISISFEKEYSLINERIPTDEK